MENLELYIIFLCFILENVEIAYSSALLKLRNYFSLIIYGLLLCTQVEWESFRWDVFIA